MRRCDCCGFAFSNENLLSHGEREFHLALWFCERCFKLTDTDRALIVQSAILAELRALNEKIASK